MRERIARAREDGTARGDLLEQYRNYLTILASRWIDLDLKAKADAADVVQETLFEVHREFDAFSGSSEPELAAWLRRALGHNLVDFARAYRGSARDIGRECSLNQELDRSSIALAGVLICTEATPSTAAQARELAVVLADALRELDEEHRQVVVLRNLRELSWEEVGEALERSPDAARMLWRRAIRRLRPLIEARY